MLLHRLPLDRSELCSLSSDAPAYDVTLFPVVRLRHWMAVALCLDLAGAACMALVVCGTPALPLPGHLAAGQFAAAQFAAAIAASIAVWLLAARSQRLYSRSTVVAGRSTLPQALATCALAFGAELLLAIATGLPRGVAGAAMVTLGCVAWVVVSRLAWQSCLHRVLRRGACIDRALVLAGSAAAARQAASTIERRHDGRIRVAASAPLPGVPGSPGLAWVQDAVQRQVIDRIVIADCDQESCAYGTMLPWLMRLAIEVTLMPSSDAYGILPLRIGPGGLVAANNVANWPLNGGQALVKRAEDVAVGFALLLITLPLMLLIALIIKLDSPGPALFIQKRVGLRGSVFRMWKFRTMHHHLADSSSTQQTSRNDRRVTRVGRFLRRTSLDELPQLVNVLRGDMSVVGPRPHALGMTVAGRQLHDIAEEYHARHLVKPGITGWAQINGCRGEVDTERKIRRRVALDCHYIDNWSVGIDAWIVLRTATLLLFDRHAY